jgi:hypothetical protein
MTTLLVGFIRAGSSQHHDLYVLYDLKIAFDIQTFLSPLQAGCAVLLDRRLAFGPGATS